MNVFLKKTVSSALGLPGEQVEAILNAAEAFKSNEINRELAMKLFNKFATKTPKEINKILEAIDMQF